MSWNIFWIILIIYSLLPYFRQRQVTTHRIQLIRRIEQQRGSRLITLIHRQESMSLLGLPISRYITIEDSEQVLRAIRLTPDDMPIDIILHTPGGLVLASEQIAHAIKRHPAKVTVFVPHYAMSGGTLLALAADEIVLDENAVLGPVDPQLGNYPAASILKTVNTKKLDALDDETLILADIAEKAMRQVQHCVYCILKDKMPEEKARDLAAILTEGHWTHDYPITREELCEMGLTVCDNMPREIYSLMEFYPQPAQRRPSVQYIPLPYQKPGNPNR